MVNGIKGIGSDHVMPIANEADIEQPLAESFQRSLEILQDLTKPINPRIVPEILAQSVEPLAHELYVEERAKQLGIWEPDAYFPNIFVEAKRATSRQSVGDALFLPATADPMEIEYRALALSSILSFTSEERIVVVFSQTNSDIRQFVVPQINSLFREEGIPYRYIRFADRRQEDETGAADVSRSNDIPINHWDLESTDIEKIANHSYFEKTPDGSFLILDFLDFYRRLNSPRRWSVSYQILFSKISNFLEQNSGHLIVFINLNPLANRKRRSAFLDIARAMNLKDTHFAAIGLNPQFMSVDQAAAYLELDPLEVRVIATRIPLLPEILIKLKEAMAKLPFELSIKNFIRGLEDKDLVLTRRGELHIIEKRRLAAFRSAFRPKSGISYYILGGDGSTVPIAKTALPVPLPSQYVRNILKRSSKYESWYEKIYKLSPSLRSIPDKFFETPLALAAELSRRRAAIMAELDSAKVRCSGEMGMFVNALFAAGRIIDKSKRYRCQRWASAYDLFERSRILQNVKKSDIATPQKFTETLVKLRPRIVEEQRMVRNVSASTLKRYSLDTLAYALAAGGKISGDVTPYLFIASGREFYDKSAILQGISEDDLSTPEKLVARLRSSKPQIVEEQRELRGANAEEPVTFKLITFVYALIGGGRLKDKFWRYLNLVGELERYENSPLLQDISDEDLSTPLRLIEKLVTLRRAIAEEQRASRKKKAGIPDEYKLITLVNSLGAVGRISKKKLQTYQRMAGARDLYDNSETLQNFHVEEDESPAKLFLRLLKLLPEVVEEQRAMRKDVSPDDLPDSISTLIKALVAGGKIEKRTHLYVNMAPARELYERSPLLQNIKADDLSTPKKLLTRLIALRPAIVKEQRQIRGADADKLKDYSFTYLVLALLSVDKLNGPAQPFERLARGRDLFENSPILRRIPKRYLKSPEKLVRHLASLRASIVEEQRRARRATKERLEYYALGTLVDALEAGERFQKSAQLYERIAGAYDIFDRSPTLRNIGQEFLSDDRSLIRFLLAHRDRIAVENLHATQRLMKDRYLSPDAGKHFALNTLIDALYAAGLIDKTRAQNLEMRSAGPMEYFINRREIIEGEILRTIDEYSYWPVIDRSLFTYLKNPAKQLSRKYIANIVKWARWFLKDKEVAVRSIYHADEIAGITLFGLKDLWQHVPVSFASRLEIEGNAGYEARQNKNWTAASAARTNVVETLKDLLNHVETESNESLRQVFQEGLSQVQRLINWNLQPGMLGIAATQIGPQTVLYNPALLMTLPLTNIVPVTAGL